MKTRSFEEWDKKELESFMKALVQKNLLNQVPEIVAEQFPNKVDQDKFNRQFFEYQIQHAYHIYHWQMDLLEPIIFKEISKKKDELLTRAKLEVQTKNLHPSITQVVLKNAENEAMRRAIILNEHRFDKAAEEICKQFILNIIELIQKTEWKVGFGGVNVPGKTEKVPLHVAKIYEECGKAVGDDNYLLHFNEIGKIGLKAAEKPRFEFFGLTKRDKQTQEFYNLFQKTFEAKQAALNHPKAGG